ncbi:unnamed protein product [Closterium sp. Yama58-4]|nr:unnamed protein product [Closterium sp. Yama58-4]
MTDVADGVSLLAYVTGTVPTPAETAPAPERAQWELRDAVARLVIRNHLPISERAHFNQLKTAKTLYDAVVARYSAPATATVGSLILPYLFPDLASFHTAADLITHLRASDARFRAALTDEFLATNTPPLYFTLYILVTRLPDTLRSVRDHFLAKDPPTITLDDFEQQLVAAEKNILAVGAARGTPRTPLFEGSQRLPLLVGSVVVAGAARVAGVAEVAVEGAVVEAAGVVEVVGVDVGVEAVGGVAAGPGAVEAAAAAAVVGEEAAAVAVEVGVGVDLARRVAPLA